MHLFSVRTK